MFDIGVYSCSSASADASSSSRRNKRSKNNRRRFSDEQIKSLETMFETETRLEPRKKLQLAKELGLQPRQVAIWFQNKRARWKFKQLEHDYSVLRDDYNALASRLESLKKEKHALAVQLQKLNDLLQKNGETKSESEEEKLRKTSFEQSGHLGVVSEEDSSMRAEYFGLDQEETNLMSIIEPADGSLTSQEDWGNLDSDTLFDQSNSSCAWWDFWA